MPACKTIHLNKVICPVGYNINFDLFKIHILDNSAFTKFKSHAIMLKI